MIKVEALRKSFIDASAHDVLRDVNLAVADGEYVAIMGESGSGKSTLLNLIGGLDTPDAGRIEIDGVAIEGMDDDARTRMRARKLGFVFQAFHLLPHLSVAQNVALPLALSGARDTIDAVDEMLRAVGLGERAQSYPRELSGGEMQRVAVARALVHRPALVLADEPTGNLDAKNAEQILRLLREQTKSRNAAGILVTHSSAAARTADRVYRLARGVLQLAVVT
jgi:putative ABC transport system ATP-binding protein